MPPTSVVIVGAGHAGVQAAVSLREEGYEGDIALFPPRRTCPISARRCRRRFSRARWTSTACR